MKKYLKSIHIRYMLTFMTIMIFTIMILGVIIASIITNFSLDMKLKEVYSANSKASYYFKPDEKNGKLPQITDEKTGSLNPELEEILDTILLVSPQSGVLVFDEKGELLLYAAKNGDSNIIRQSYDESMSDLIEKPTLSKSFLNLIMEERVISKNTACDGYFSNEVYVYASAITTKVEVEVDTDIDNDSDTNTDTNTDSNVSSEGSDNKENDSEIEPEPVWEDVLLGAIVCYDPGNTEEDKMMDKMLVAIISTLIWITIASLVAIYGVSYYTMRPLREIGRAAKSFSRGRFDVRVKVRGNDELAELADNFNKMAIAIESKDEMQKNFLSNVSHDLKTPMTTIAGFVDGILDGAIPVDKQDYYLNIIKNEVKRLSRLVTSLLDISRLQSGERKFEFKQFNICELTRQTVLSFENQLEEKKLDVEFDMDDFDMMAYGDKDAINQVIYNLCHNAIKFSYQGAKYKVSLKYEDEKTIRFTMFNEGIGITSEDLPFVFDRFYKSDKSRGLDKTGTGLGLFISKTIIDAHSQSMVAKSDYGKWCEMTFTIARYEKSLPKGEE